MIKQPNFQGATKHPFILQWVYPLQIINLCYKFRAITGHQGPLSPQDENYNGSKYNVMVEWETGEMTDESLSLITADDPVTCAIYAKKHDLLNMDGSKRLKHIAKNQKHNF